LFECYGFNRQTAGAKFEDFRSSAGFMDLHWPGTLIRYSTTVLGVPVVDQRPGRWLSGGALAAGAAASSILTQVLQGLVFLLSPDASERAFQFPAR